MLEMSSLFYAINTKITNLGGKKSFFHLLVSNHITHHELDNDFSIHVHHWGREQHRECLTVE